MFDIEHRGRRVRVFLRSDGDRLRLIALCEGALRATVSRALTQASFLLAGGGKRMDASIVERRAR